MEQQQLGRIGVAVCVHGAASSSGFMSTVCIRDFVATGVRAITVVAATMTNSQSADRFHVRPPVLLESTGSMSEGS
jgi:hypothetical protein